MFALHDAEDDDIVMLLDADEIPSREVLQRLRTEGLDMPRRMLMTRHYEAADLLGPRSACCASTSAPFPFALGRRRPQHWDKLSIEWFSRSGVALPVRALGAKGSFGRQAPFDVRRTTPLAGALPDAGRHLCFVDPSCRPQRKLGRVAHAEFAVDLTGLTSHLSHCAEFAIHHRGWWYAERPAGALPADLMKLAARDSGIRCGERIPPALIRHVVRSWTWLRHIPVIPEQMVRAVETKFRLWMLILSPVLILLDLVRAVAARFGTVTAKRQAEARAHLDR